MLPGDQAAGIVSTLGQARPGIDVRVPGGELVQRSDEAGSVHLNLDSAVATVAGVQVGNILAVLVQGYGHLMSTGLGVYGSVSETIAVERIDFRVVPEATPPGLGCNCRASCQSENDCAIGPHSATGLGGKPRASLCACGADGRIRTADLLITNRLITELHAVVRCCTVWGLFSYKQVVIGFFDRSRLHRIPSKRTLGVSLRLDDQRCPGPRRYPPC